MCEEQEEVLRELKGARELTPDLKRRKIRSGNFKSEFEKKKSISRPTCHTQSRKRRKTGDSLPVVLEKAEFLQRERNGWPAWIHSRSMRASNLQEQRWGFDFLGANLRQAQQTYPRMVRQSAWRITCTRDVICNVRSKPSQPCTSTEKPSRSKHCAATQEVLRRAFTCPSQPQDSSCKKKFPIILWSALFCTSGKYFTIQFGSSDKATPSASKDNWIFIFLSWWCLHHTNLNVDNPVLFYISAYKVPLTNKCFCHVVIIKQFRLDAEHGPGHKFFSILIDSKTPNFHQFLRCSFDSFQIHRHSDSKLTPASDVFMWQSSLKIDNYARITKIMNTVKSSVIYQSKSFQNGRGRP